MCAHCLLPCHWAPVKSLAPSSLLPPFRYLYTLMRSRSLKDVDGVFSPGLKHHAFFQKGDVQDSSREEQLCFQVEGWPSYVGHKTRRKLIIFLCPVSPCRSQLSTHSAKLPSLKQEETIWGIETKIECLF